MCNFKGIKRTQDLASKVTESSRDSNEQGPTKSEEETRKGKKMRKVDSQEYTEIDFIKRNIEVCYFFVLLFVCYLFSLEKKIEALWVQITMCLPYLEVESSCVYMCVCTACWYVAGD